MSDPTTPLGQRIRAERQRRGWTQAELARRMGENYTRKIVSQAETDPNVRRLWPALLADLARALDLDPDELYSLGDRIPVDLEVRLRGDLDAIKRTRKALTP